MLSNFDNPQKTLEALSSCGNDIEALSQLSNILLKSINEKHISIATKKEYPSAISQCYLECLRLIYNFKSNAWIATSKARKYTIKEGEKPITFKRLTQKGETISYSLYNIDQLTNIIEQEVDKQNHLRKVDKQEEIAATKSAEIIKFSGGYVPINPNFVISIPEGIKTINSELKGIIAISRNILFRGCPIPATEFLKSKIGLVEKYGGFYYSKDENELFWDDVIKGGDFSNPANEFYKILKEEFPEIYKLFLPECPLNSILKSQKYPITAAVDFYDPLHKIVIEIDGAQHQEKESIVVDKVRDQEFRKNGINVIRIKTSEIHSESIKNHIKKLQRSFTTFIPKGINFKENISEIEIEYLYAFRFQVALLLALEKGLISEADKKFIINLKLKHKVRPELFQYCIKDLSILINHLYTLLDSKINLPEIQITFDNENRSNLTIDIDVTGKYDQSIFSSRDNTIVIRNDYFFYPLKDSIKHPAFDYASFKNYYKVCCSDIRFKNVRSENNAQHLSLLYFLKCFFGFDEFRPYQEQIICDGLDPKKGVIGLLPTGSGKSLCFQFVGMLTAGISIVISPLTSLMQDQCENLYKRNKISTVGFINSEELGKQNLWLFKQDQLKFVYITPERFFNRTFLNLFGEQSYKISQIVVDEVHCLSEWGHDFRTSYLLLFGFLREMTYYKKILLMGTSGTASLRVLNDIEKEFLKLEKKVVIEKSRSVERPELTFGIHQIKPSKEIEQEKYLKKQYLFKNSLELCRATTIGKLVSNYIQKQEKTIIFVPYAKTHPKIIEKEICSMGTFKDKIAVFTGETKPAEKAKIISSLKSGKILVVIATKAFGMGIDIPDIRHTIHFGIGSSVESTYQEMGRAGRDKKHSDCFICFFKDEYDKNLFKTKPKLDTIGDGIELKYQVNLVKINNKDPLTEADFTYEVFKILQNSDGILPLNKVYFMIPEEYKDSNKNSKGIPNSFETKFEKALYKLYLLDIIDLWNINYDHGIEDPIYSNLNIFNRTEEELIASLLKYIGNYDSTYEFPPEYYEQEEEYHKKIIQQLCKWGFDNFFMTRWLSLGNLYDMLYNFTTSEKFVDRINNYFSDNKNIENMFKNPNKIDLLFKVLNEDSPEILKDQVARYIEEYNNYSLNFISGIINLQLGNFKSVSGENRLKNAFDYMIKSTDLQFTMTELIEKTFLYLKTDYEKIVFYEFIHGNYPILLDHPIIENILKKATWKNVVYERHYFSDLKVKLQKLKTTIGG